MKVKRMRVQRGRCLSCKTRVYLQWGEMDKEWALKVSVQVLGLHLTPIKTNLSYQESAVKVQVSDLAQVISS